MGYIPSPRDAKRKHTVGNGERSKRHVCEQLDGQQSRSVRARVCVDRARDRRCQRICVELAIASASVNVGANGTAFGIGDRRYCAFAHIFIRPERRTAMEVRWTASAIARDINYFRCTPDEADFRRSWILRRSYDGNSSRNVYVFSDESADATAVYTALVGEIDFQGNTVASAGVHVVSW